MFLQTVQCLFSSSIKSIYQNTGTTNIDFQYTTLFPKVTSSTPTHINNDVLL